MTWVDAKTYARQASALYRRQKAPKTQNPAGASPRDQNSERKRPNRLKR